MSNAFSKESRIILVVLFISVAVFSVLELRDIAHDEKSIELLGKNIHSDDARLDSLEARVKALEDAAKKAPTVAQ